MTLHPKNEWIIPAETVRVARAAFPKGNVYMMMRDQLGQFYHDQDFQTLFRADCGQSALSPGQLALMTTPATTHDGAITDKIHQALALKELLPSEHLMDTAYVDAQHLVTSWSDYEIELIGPVTPDSSWQAKAQQGFDISCFAVDWEAQTVVCPAGKPSQAWRRRLDDYGNPVIEVRFNRDDCAACTLRQQCTRAKKEPRLLKLRPQKLHQALQAARLRQTTAEFKQRYACASWGRRHPLSRYSRL